MSDPKHSPEPWTVDDEHDALDIVRSRGSLVGEFYWAADDRPRAVRTAEAEANAARTVACVNACEGIANPAALRELIEAARILPTNHDSRLRRALAALDEETRAKPEPRLKSWNSK